MFSRALLRNKNCFNIQQFSRAKSTIPQKTTHDEQIKEHRASGLTTPHPPKDVLTAEVISGAPGGRISLDHLSTAHTAQKRSNAAKFESTSQRRTRCSRERTTPTTGESTLTFSKAAADGSTRSWVGHHRELIG